MGSSVLTGRGETQGGGWTHRDTQTHRHTHTQGWFAVRSPWRHRRGRGSNQGTVRGGGEGWRGGMFWNSTGSSNWCFLILAPGGKFPSRVWWRRRSSISRNYRDSSSTGWRERKKERDREGWETVETRYRETLRETLRDR